MPAQPRHDHRFTQSTDKIAFSNAGFSLGLSGASATPKPLPPSLFVANSTGRFTSPTQRFAYNTTTGALDYDAKGYTAGSSKEFIATLTDPPTLAASDLLFVSWGSPDRDRRLTGMSR